MPLNISVVTVDDFIFGVRLFDATKLFIDDAANEQSIVSVSADKSWITCVGNSIPWTPYPHFAVALVSLAVFAENFEAETVNVSVIKLYVSPIFDCANAVDAANVWSFTNEFDKSFIKSWLSSESSFIKLVTFLLILMIMMIEYL